MANMNVRPYYEDFDDSKNFYRILFRPSFSLQARELTQSQTLIYDQLEKVSALSDGDKISSGEITYDNGTVYLNSGTYYVNGVAVSVDSDELSGVINGKVGFKVLEQFVSPEEDQTLYDNAYGTPNYLAPGAHRYKIDLELVSRDLDYTSTDDFIEIFRVVNSKVQKLSTDVKTESSLLDDFDINLTETSDSYIVGLSNGTISSNNEMIDVIDQNVTISKPRETVNVSSVTTNANDGNYVVGGVTSAGWESATFLHNWDSEDTITIVDLYDENVSSIGTGVITNIAYYNASKVKIYLSEVSFSSPESSLGDITSIYESGSAILGVDSVVETTSGNPISIFPFSETNITKSVTSSKDLFYRRRAVDSQTVQGDQTKALDIPSSDSIVIESDFNLLDIDMEQLVIIGPIENSSAALYNIDNLDMNRTGSVVSPKITVTKKVDSSFAAGTYKIFHDIFEEASPSTERSVYTKTNHTQTIDASSQYLAAATSHELEKKYIIPSSVTVVQANGSDITNRFLIDDGQRDGIITFGKITVKAGMDSISSELTVSYDYWDLTTKGRYATVDSYLQSAQTDNAILELYNDIPTYNGIKLSDSLDLRRHEDGFLAWSSSGQMEITESRIYGDRTDKITVDPNGVLNSIKGIPYNDQKLVPSDNENLTLFEVELNGYGYNTNDLSLSKSIKQELSKSDLNNFEERLSKLEIDSKFSPLETEALTQTIPDTTESINAVLVDSFLGHNVGDTENIDYMSAIDYETNELRPSYNSRYVSLTNTDTSFKGNSLTLGVTAELSDVSNLKGTDVIAINEFSDRYNGTLVLNPNKSLIKSSDREQVLFDDSGYFSNITNLVDETKTTNTIWKDWELFWHGSDIKSNPIIELINREDKKIGINYKPHFTANDIEATVTGLAPLLNHNVFIGGVKVTEITTGSKGEHEFSSNGVLQIPANGLSGKVLVEIKSDDGLSKASSYYHNEGIGNFLDYGESEGSVSQEFEVFEDTFFSKVDLYFSKKDDTLPVNVQIREMVNGIPSKNIILSESVAVDSINVIGATTVQFSPIDTENISLKCLKKGKYCITVIGNSSYELYGDKKGVSDLDVGRFYRGASEIIDFKMKFNLYRAKFETSASGKTFDLQTEKINSSIDKIYANPEVDNQIIVYQDNHGYTPYNDNVTIEPGAGLPIEELTLDNPGDSGFSVFGTLPAGTLVFSGDYTTDYSDVTTWGYVMSDMSSGNTQVPTQGGKIKIAVITGSFIGNTSNMVTDGELVRPLTLQGQVLENTQFTGANYFALERDGDGLTVGTITPETHIAGIDTTKFGSGSVQGATRSYFTWQPTTSLIPKTLGYTTPPEDTVIKDVKLEVDNIYIKSEQNQPGKTELDWLSGSKEIPIQPNMTNSFDEDASIQYGFKVRLTPDSTNDRFSPVVYMDDLKAVLISNNIDEQKIGTADPINLNVLGTSSDFGLSLYGNAIRVDLLDVLNADVGDDIYVQLEKLKNMQQKWLALEQGDILYVSSENGATGYVKVVEHLYYTDNEANNLVDTYQAPFIDDSNSGLSAILVKPAFVISVTKLDNEPLPHADFGTTADNPSYLSTIYSYTGQVMETNISGSTSMSKYISKRISIPISSNSICVEFMGDISAGNEVEVYYNIDDLEYKKLPNYSSNDVTTSGIFPTGGTSGYQKIVYLGGVSSFNFLQIKLVFKGSNSMNVPKIKDLKIFAYTGS